MVYGLGERLYKLRKEHQMRQKDVAQRIGKTDSAVGSYETEAALPSLEVAVTLADIFGVSLDYLVRGEQCNVLWVKGLTAEQKDLLMELTQEFRRSTRQGRKLSAQQKDLLARLIEEFTK